MDETKTPILKLCVC